MSARSFRLETRSRARDEIKRIMQTVEKVRKWEKIWIETGLSNHLKVYKWVPVREEGKKDGDKPGKEVEGTEETGGGDRTDNTLPEILPAKELTASLDPPQLAGPPDMLLETEAKPTHTSTPNERDGSVASGDRDKQQEVDLERRRERQNLAAAEDKHRPRSPH